MTHETKGFWQLFHHRFWRGSYGKEQIIIIGSKFQHALLITCERSGHIDIFLPSPEECAQGKPQRSEEDGSQGAPAEGGPDFLLILLRNPCPLGQILFYADLLMDQILIPLGNDEISPHFLNLRFFSKICILHF